MFYLFRVFVALCWVYPGWFMVIDISLTTLVLFILTVGVIQSIRKKRKGVKQRGRPQPKEEPPAMA